MASHVALSREIKTHILTRHLTEPPACALALLCPEWDLCCRDRANHALDAITRNTRVDVYTLPNPLRLADDRPVPGPHPPPPAAMVGGRVTTVFDHGRRGPADCVLVPVMRDPRAELCGLPEGLGRELAREWAGSSVFVASQRGGTVGPRWVGMAREEAQAAVLLREEAAARVLPFADDDCCLGRVFGVDGVEKEALPRVGGEDAGPRYLFQRLAHLVVNTVPEVASAEVCEVGMLPSAWGPVVLWNLEILGERLEYERRANLFLRWDAMERLETLSLDLRGFNYPVMRYLREEDVVDIARSLWGMNLAVLVVAGLRSWLQYPGFEALETGEVETGTWAPEKGAWVDENRAGTVNWWQLFARAVRPGGKLVFVDKQDGDGLRPQRLA
ncbi:hypothetical protein BT67DRAFT_443850 [Trichocladium antarcticum]|uniref:Uncharacterized protein n=1 Tax=Trichocladium antarcticum TaxID=1450529 RepID=A0AAN6UGC2_9PEZI|nr:hypothetical protein BT67DRAFT_443850 [Trichocladium antarcticum]